MISEASSTLPEEYIETALLNTSRTLSWALRNPESRLLKRRNGSIPTSTSLARSGITNPTSPCVNGRLKTVFNLVDLLATSLPTVWLQLVFQFAIELVPPGKALLELSENDQDVSELRQVTRGDKYINCVDKRITSKQKLCLPDQLVNSLQEELGYLLCWSFLAQLIDLVIVPNEDVRQHSPRVFLLFEIVETLPLCVFGVVQCLLGGVP